MSDFNLNRFFKRWPYYPAKIFRTKIPLTVHSFPSTIAASCMHCENKVFILANILQWRDLLIHCWKNIHVVGADT